MTPEEEAPDFEEEDFLRPASVADKLIDLDKMLVPWVNSGPAVIALRGSPAFYLAVFSTFEKLREFMDQAEYIYDDAKQIDNGDTFLHSIPTKFGNTLFEVIADPWFNGDGAVRYVRVIR